MRVQGAIAKTELVAVSRRLGLVLVAFALVPGLAFAGQGGPQRYKPVAKDVRWAKDSVLHSEDVPLQYRRDPGRYAGVMLPQCPGYYAPDRSDLIGTGTAEAYFRSGNSGLGSVVSVFASQMETGKWWKRVVTDRYVTCLARQLAAHAGGGFKARILSASRLRMKLNFAQPSAEFRTVIRYTKGGRSVDAMWVAVFFQHSRAIAVVSDTNVFHPCECAERLAQHVFGRMARSEPHCLFASTNYTRPRRSG